MTQKLLGAADRFFAPTHLAPDRYGQAFYTLLTGMLLVTLVTFALIFKWWDVRWFAAEDGLTEWSTFSAYTLSAGFAATVGILVRRLGHRRMAWVQFAMAGLFLLIALEEISWGQRVFDWGTPQALAAVNHQEETNLHNFTNVDQFTNVLTWIVGSLGLIGGVARAVLHRHGRVTTLDFLLPSLVIAPALALVVIWNLGGPTLRDAMEAIDLRPIGDETPETLAALSALIFTAANLRRARALA